MEEWPTHVTAGIAPVRFGMTVADVSNAVSGRASEQGGSAWVLGNGLRVTVEDERGVEISVTPWSSGTSPTNA